MKQLSGKELHLQAKSRSDGPSVVLDHVENPDNIGSILRLAEAFGCLHVYYLGEAAVLTHPKVRKVSMGCEDYLNLHLNYYPTPVTLVAVEITTDSTSIFTEPLQLTDVLVVGSERHGISQEVLDACTKSVHIPMFGVKGSINVASALAIVLYECRRQNSG